MDFSSYLRVLLSIWVGLGLGQLVQAFNRVARFRGVIEWDWLPLTWAALSFLMFVQVWWAYFTLLQAPIWANLFAFLLPMAVFVTLYLICTAALPDLTRIAEGTTVSLRRHYLDQHRYYFTLWAVLLSLAVLVSGLTRGGFRPLGGDGFRVVAIAAAVVLAVSANRRTHAVVTLASLAALVLYIVLFTLRLA